MRAWLRESFSIDLRSLALFRVVLAGSWLLILGLKAPIFGAFFTEAGVNPLATARAFFPNTWMLFPHLWAGAAWYQAALTMLALGSAISLLVGYRTRISAAACWVFCLSVLARTEITFCGMEMYIACFLFPCIFLPCGEVASMDAYRTHGTAVPFFPQPRIFGFWAIFTVLSLCYLYFSAGFFKSGVMWREGSAAYVALSYRQISTPLGEYLLNFPLLLKFSTFLVRYAEIAFPFFVLFPWWPLRTFMLVLMALLHLGVAVSMNHGALSYICLGGLALLWREREWAFFKKIFTITKPAAAPAVSSWREGYISKAVCSVAGIFILFFIALKIAGSAPPAAAEEARYGLRWPSLWNFYTPNPPRDDGYWVISGLDGNLSLVYPFEPLRLKASVNSAPSRIDRQFSNPYWLVYSFSIRRLGDAANMRIFADYICRAWRGRNENSLQLIELQYVETDRYSHETFLRNYFSGPCPSQEKI